METINKVELQGTVGFTKLLEAGEKKVLHFSLVTNRVGRDKGGNNFVETSWHNMEAWEGPNIPDLTKIVKGTTVHVLGRLRYTRYIGSDNVERTATDIVVTRLDILDATAA